MWTNTYTHIGLSLYWKILDVTLSSQHFTSGFVPFSTAPGAAAGFLNCVVREPRSPATGCQSRSCSPPGLTRGEQNRPSGRERASPCQNQLAFSCIQMRKIGKGDLPSWAITYSLEGRSKCSMVPRREPEPLSLEAQVVDMAPLSRLGSS